MFLMMIGVMCFFLILSYPMIIPLIIAPIAVAAVYYPALDPMNLVQQMLVGVRPLSLVAVPMFIFAADVISTGQVARRSPSSTPW